MRTLIKSALTASLVRCNRKLKKLKVLTVVGTRPEIVRLSRVLAKLDQYCEHILIHTGQNFDYELNEIFFADLGIPGSWQILTAVRFLETVFFRNGFFLETGFFIFAQIFLLRNQAPPTFLKLAGNYNPNQQASYSSLIIIALNHHHLTFMYAKLQCQCNFKILTI